MILAAYCVQLFLSSSFLPSSTTTIAIANGVSTEVIAKILGHKNLRTTQLYAKVCQPEVDQEFNRLNQIYK